MSLAIIRFPINFSLFHSTSVLIALFQTDLLLRVWGSTEERRSPAAVHSEERKRGRETTSKKGREEREKDRWKRKK